MKRYLGWIIRGVAMGAANVIPGVSGGTIAFITGIYERLINGLKSFDREALILLFTGRIKDFSNKTDLRFLLSIFAGIGIGIIGFARILEHAFQNYESQTLSFFFGLIIASIIGVGKQIEKYTPVVIAGLILGAVLAGSIAFLPPAEANSNFMYLTLCGMVAICSMILPGLSGSYILLLMGNYVLVLQAINSADVSILAPVALGCISGVLAFSWLLSFLFKHYKDLTISLLTGFVAGSLAVIWPWKTTKYILLESGKQKPSGYSWHWPEMDSVFLWALILALIGFLLVWSLEKFTSKPEKA
ncbi:DUF368 domain-containing protein [Reichenbachiella sp. MALMAid0571]|uniref:DUF368 domain-containing protein n=1 Tax=Reichenbachiella sp. MALMAid0571 TaxID=3143939 RepID=UPI0032DF05B6